MPTRLPHQQAKFLQRNLLIFTAVGSCSRKPPNSRHPTHLQSSAAANSALPPPAQLSISPPCPCRRHGLQSATTRYYTCHTLKNPSTTCCFHRVQAAVHSKHVHETCKTQRTSRHLLAKPTCKVVQRRTQLHHSAPQLGISHHALDRTQLNRPLETRASYAAQRPRAAEVRGLSGGPVLVSGQPLPRGL
jgi:hypothetical protein